MRFVAFGLFVLLLGPALAAPERASFAELFPADTFLYLEADAGALERGLAQLDVAKVLEDPAIRAFLAPALKQAGLDAERPVAALLERSPIPAWLHGRAAFGVRGFVVTTVGADGAAQSTRVSPEAPLGADLAFRIFGNLVAPFAGGPAATAGIRVQPDLLVAVEPGPQLKSLVAEALEHPPIPMERREAEIAGRKVEHLILRPFPMHGPGFDPTFELFADLSGDRWLVATQRDTLEQAIAGNARGSLAAAPGFVTLRDRITAGERALFAYADLAGALRLGGKLVPPFVAEAAALVGISSVRGAGFGVSFAEGGVRESVGFLLDGDPKGVLRILDAFPAGIDGIRTAPASSAAFVAVKFDPGLLLRRVSETAAALLPGVDPAPLFAQGGLDALAALGDEASLFVLAPGPLQPIPDWAVRVKVRDAEAASALLERGLAELAKHGFSVARREGVIDVRWKQNALIGGTMQMRKDQFVVASNASVLAKLGEGGGDGGSLADSGPVFRRTLAGATGGDAERLVALAYVDLQPLVRLAPLVLAGAGGEWFDPMHTPDFAALSSHFGGVAVAVRRDGHAITLDVFSPVGAVLPGVVFAALAARHSAEEYRRRIEEMQAMLAEPGPDDAYVGFAGSFTDEGVEVTTVTPEAPGARAGLAEGDRIVTLDGESVAGIVAWRRAFARRKPGETVVLAVVRGAETTELTVTLGRRGDFVK